MKLKIKNGDLVEVITGADKGKKGNVLDLDSKKLRLKVQGVKVQTKHDKQDGLQKMEAFIDYSNVKLVEKAKTTAKKKKKKKASATK